MEREQAVRLTQNLLRKMIEREGSDLFLTKASRPRSKSTARSTRLRIRRWTGDQAAIMVRSIMNDKQIKEFDATKECNFAISPQGIGRFRVSAFIQQGDTLAPCCVPLRPRFLRSRTWIYRRSSKTS